MNWICRLTPFVLCLFLTVGCGDREMNVGNSGGNNNTGNQSTNGDREEPMPEFFEANKALVEARCVVIFDCCDAQERLERFGLEADNIDDCVVAEQGIFGGLGGFGLEISWSQGRIDFHEGKAELCEASLQNLSCADFDGTRDQRENLPGCRDMIEGLVADGDTCNGDFECQSDYCFFDVHAGDEDGTCQTPPSVGEDCPKLRCDANAYCHRFDTICIEKQMNGESCLRDDECISDYCREDAEGDLFCQSRPTICEG